MDRFQKVAEILTGLIALVEVALGRLPQASFFLLILAVLMLLDIREKVTR